MELQFFQIVDTEEKAKALWQTQQTRPQILFKHSFRCGISLGALYALEPFLEEMQSHADLYLIDVVNYKSISMGIATQFNVLHQSPQVIIWQNQKVIYHASHAAIQGHVILQKINACR